MEKPPTVTAQQHRITIRNGYPVVYDTDQMKTAKELLMLMLARHRPKTPIQGPIELYVGWRFHSKSHKDGTWKTTRPDADNSMKMLQDCMTKMQFWNDDSQIVRLMVEKYWSDYPGIHIRIRELPKKRGME